MDDTIQRQQRPHRAFSLSNLRYIMRRREFPRHMLAVVLAAAASASPALGQSGDSVGEPFFADKLYPILHAAQCARCHSDNGVASETQLEFPRADAPPAEITAFGLSLLDLVDR